MINSEIFIYQDYMKKILKNKLKTSFFSYEIDDTFCIDIVYDLVFHMIISYLSANKKIRQLRSCLTVVREVGVYHCRHNCKFHWPAV